MQTVAYDKIIEVWDQLGDLDEAQSKAIAQQFMAEQPAIGVYLLAQSENMEEGDDDPADNFSFDLAIAIWQALTEAASRPLTSVPPETIEAAEEKNLKMLEKLDQGPEMAEAGAALGLMNNYNQRDLLGFALEVIMSPHADHPDLAPESVGMELLTIKTVIDCLDQ